MLDLSCRNNIYDRWPELSEQSITTADGTLKDGWRTLFETHPDRILFGTDLGPSGRHEQLEEVMDYAEGVLDALDPDIAQAIAGGNMARVMGMASP
jgi:predicted TIM-barrel fold metal-dependent hydrolase